MSPDASQLPGIVGPSLQVILNGPKTPIVDGVGNPVLNANGNPMFVPLPILDRATQATINVSFVREHNYWPSSQNIKQACYNMLTDSINDAFKFSPDPNLTGWNPSMEIVEVMDQFMTTYGQPTLIAFLQNDTLFCSVNSPLNAPEILFHQIEDCQEIHTLGDDLYTPTQLLNTAIRLILGCGLYHCIFEEWDRKDAADKIWINLKLFTQEAYQVPTQCQEQHGRPARVCTKCIHRPGRTGQ